MLPLVGQKLTVGASRDASLFSDGILFMPAAIIVAQVVMVGVAYWSGRTAGSWGRKPVFLIGFIALPIRGLLFILSDNPVYLLSVQVLDGVGAGIFGVVSIIMIADLTKGTGRFNVTQGALATAIGIGASLSNLLAGFIVGSAGFNAAFLALSGVAAVALAILWLFVPETKAFSPTQTEHEVATLEATPT